MHATPSSRPRRLGPWLLLGLAVLLAGSESPVRLMPTPVSFRHSDADPFAVAGAKLLGTDVPVLYATNRGAVVEKPEPIHTLLPSERLRLGVAHVRIGDETLSWEALHRLSTSDDPDERPIVHLQMLEPLASIGPGDKRSPSCPTLGPSSRW